MSERKQRFTDNQYKPSRRLYNRPNPFASKSVPRDFKKIKKVLLEELEQNKLYQKVWKIAVEDFNKKKLSLSPDHFNQSTPDECYVAVIAYTLDIKISVDGNDLQLYQDFNEKFRQLENELSWTQFQYKSFYYLLILARNGIKSTPSTGQNLYRGIRGLRLEISPNVGDDFYFDYFASSSSDRYVAEKFLGSGGTMVVVQNGVEAAMGITNYSYYSGEVEVLIFPCNSFKVVEFKRSRSVDVLVVEVKNRRVYNAFFGTLALSLGVLFAFILFRSS